MICPHCKTPIEVGATPENKERALELVKKGHSLRETEKILFSEGAQISYSTVSRIVRDHVTKRLSLNKPRNERRTSKPIDMTHLKMHVSSRKNPTGIYRSDGIDSTDTKNALSGHSNAIKTVKDVLWSTFKECAGTSVDKKFKRVD